MSQSDTSTLKTADGISLKLSLQRSLRRKKRNALLLVAPLFLFILITFIIPIAYMLVRSVDNQIFAEILPTTAPLRLVGDVERAIQHYLNFSSDMVITAVEAKHNPHFTMIKENSSGMVELFSCDDEKQVSRRQDAPEALGIVPVAYVTSPQFILSNQGLWGGSVSAVKVDPLSGIDIDDKYDFYLAELVAKDKRSIP